MKVGFGIIIRDDSGKVVGSSIQSIFASFCPQATEAMAIHQGILFAVETGALPLVVESDAKGVVDLINKGVPTNADLGVVVDDIISLINNFHIIVTFSPRKTNVAAHMLAKLAVQSDSNFFWLYYCPPSVEVLVMGEYPS